MLKRKECLVSNFDKRCANIKPFAHPTQANAACFVAGTLVHAKQGLVPIEQLKVGDYVLSKPESGEGEQTYQRVTETFVHEEQEVFCLYINDFTENEYRIAEKEGRYLDGSNKTCLVATPNHPFWAVGKGWVEVEDLTTWVTNDSLEFADGQQRQIFDITKVVRTLQEGIGWLMGGGACPLRFTESKSSFVDLRNNNVILNYNYEDRIENDGVEWWEEHEQDRMRRRVYNITVENTYTYYVGKLVVWVHNKNLDAHFLDELNITLSRVGCAK